MVGRHHPGIPGDFRRNQHPKAFISLLGRLVPTQVTGKDDAPLFAGLSDDELEARIFAKLMAKGMTEGEAWAFLNERH